jgi:hypothetical protein
MSDKTKNPFHYKTGNKNFESTKSLVGKIIPGGHQILVQLLEHTKVPPSKLIIAGDDSSSFFNFERGIIIRKGQESKRDYLSAGDEVYFSPMVFQNINYPNPDKGDEVYAMLSEENVVYYIKKS